MVETRSGVHVEPEDTQHIHTPETYKEATTGGGAQVHVRAGHPAQHQHQYRSTQRQTVYFAGMTMSQLYTLVALVHGGLAFSLMLGCKGATALSFGKSADPPEDQHCQLFHLYAGGLATSVSMALSLEGLSRRHLLHTYTADILKIGLIGHMVASLTLLVYHPLTVTTKWVLGEGAAAVLTGLVPALSLLTTEEDRSRLQRDIQNFPSWAIGALTRSPRRRGLRPDQRPAYPFLSIAYNLLTLIMPMAGLAYLIAPRWTLYHTFGYDYGASTHYLWRLIGGGALCTLLPCTLMALKHKADIRMMSATPARTLNLGLMGTSLGHLLVLGPVFTKGHGGFLLPGLLLTWGLGLITSILGLGAPEVHEFANEVAEAASKH